jgi:hypothetical protein
MSLQSRVLRGLATSAVLAAGLTFARPGAAQGTDEFGSYGGLEDRHQKESGQEAAFELRFGPYRPEVDTEVAGSPFEETFGNDNRYLIGIEVDWQALRVPKTLSLGPGFGWGYTRFGADALLADGSGERSEQRTSLSIMPMYAVAVLRFDAIAQQTPVPLAAYGKAGVGMALWWAGDGDGAAHSDDGTVGRGISTGFQFALGGMLLLDVLDPTSAVELDNATGVNNSYFFVEWYVSQLGRSGDQMRVGTNTWMLGLALEI